ncbi:MAG: S-layer homology domain-containing protein [Oscillospiraceae bacterium]|nr:S-layer homology domain-containing protein [Oscillospiraceae bacterium]
MKKIVSIVLALTMVFALAIPALASSYADVADDAWYAEAVEALREKGIMNGMGSGKFGPDETFTRAQLATVLYRMAGSPAVTGEDSFTDTERDTWYSDAVLWASQNEVVNGMGNGLFGANEAATQEQLTVMLWRDAGSYQLDREKYASAEGVENQASDWAFDAVVWAKVEALIADLDAYAPTKAASRAQVADMVYRYMKLKEQFANVDAVSGATQKADEQTTPTESTGGKVLVAYFSATNNTANIAKHIADATGATLYEIKPETPYTTADLNYSDSSTRAAREQNDAAARPAISGSVENMADYDVIFLGYPIWWGQAPKILYTFVESYSFDGKTIIPFCTSGSSGIGSSATNLQKSASEATWLDGTRFDGSVSEDELRAWADGLQ